MFVKWIVCRVRSGQQDAFGEAQQVWNEIGAAPGLIGQVGGWDRRAPGAACVLACWEDEASYTHFFTNLHDEIVAKNQQTLTYQRIQVHLADAIQAMPGSAESFAAALREARFLRVAECTVATRRVLHFQQVQREVWAPGMARAPGMLGGVFSGYRDDDQSFLVTTCWSDAEAHERYAQEQLPELRREAETERDLVGSVGRFIALEDAWRVLP